MTTFYKFLPLTAASLEGIQRQLEAAATEHAIVGLFLLAPEGVNATVAGKPDSVTAFQVVLAQLFGKLRYQSSVSEQPPFKRFKVKIKPEIVQLKRPDVVPTGRERHVSPAEWEALLADEQAVVIDVRNSYESAIGTFQGAVVPQTKYFSEFPTWLAKSDVPKNVPVGIFCTGGIRCEKAAVAMREQGYTNVVQLDGGIVNYLEQRPNQQFVGECFVFDHRVAVDQRLAPSQLYKGCVYCGNPGRETHQCVRCEASFTACAPCMTQQSVHVCSRNCRYQYQLQQDTRETTEI